MRKDRIMAVALATAFVVTTAVFAGNNAVAASTDDNNAAIVLKDLDHPFGCFLGVGGIPLSTTDQVQTVATSSGNVRLTCHFDIPEGFQPATAQRFTNFGCGIFLPTGSVSTFDTMAERTPGGRALLVCEVKGNDLP